MEQAFRAVLRRKAIALGDALRSREFVNLLGTIIDQQIKIFEHARREALRRKPSKGYQQIFQDLAAKAETVDLRSLPSFKLKQIETAEKLFDGMMDGLRGRDGVPGSVDPTAFLSLVEKIFNPPKKRGRKYSVDYDAAFERRVKKEPASTIAREIDPRGYAKDPEACVAKFHKAFRRRLRDLSRAEGM